jgi:hypothetical protein
LWILNTGVAAGPIPANVGASDPDEDKEATPTVGPSRAEEEIEVSGCSSRMLFSQSGEDVLKIYSPSWETVYIAFSGAATANYESLLTV